MAESTKQKTNIDGILSRIIVDQGLATPQEVDDCLALQKEIDAEDPKNKSLAALLVSNGIVTQRQLHRIKPLLDEQKPNQQLPGYQIQGKLGAGAMATVYKARQISLDRTVAIKILPKKFLDNPEFVSRFYGEGKAAAKLNHPNIVAALDVGQAGEYHYFVMEFVEGRTVHDDLQEHKHYNEQEAIEIVIQVAKALEHAHKAGFIHRDVKPKNIMITKDGTVKLADMGLARAVSDREMAEAEKGRAFGTPYYIAPEQIRGEVDIDFRADIYSLGATFYHLVTGQVPFDAPNPSGVMHKHLREELIPPDHINPHLSAGIGEIIEVCMAKDRTKRYNASSDLLQDLENVKRGEAPLQARKKFDLSTLAELEQSATPSEVLPVSMPAPEPTLLQQPLFWAAAAGWALAGLLLLALLFMLLTGP